MLALEPQKLALKEQLLLPTVHMPEAACAETVPLHGSLWVADVSVTLSAPLAVTVPVPWKPAPQLNAGEQPVCVTVQVGRGQVPESVQVPATSGQPVPPELEDAEPELEPELEVEVASPELELDPPAPELDPEPPDPPLLEPPDPPASFNLLAFTQKSLKQVSPALQVPFG